MSHTGIGQGLLSLLCLSLLGCPRVDTNRVEDLSDFRNFEFQAGGFMLITGDVLAIATIQRQADERYLFEAILDTISLPEPDEVRDADGRLHLPPRILTDDEVARMLLAFSHVEMHTVLTFQPCYTDQFAYDFHWDDFEGVNGLNCRKPGDQIVNDPSVEEISQMLDDFWHAGG
jgi:hypothetical protein